MSEVELEQLTWCKKCDSYRGFIDALIYKITDLTNEKFYIGSSKHELDCRLKGHKNDYKRFKKGRVHYCTSFEILENDNYKVEVIEQSPCNNKKELVRREGHYIRKAKQEGGKCVNKYIPGRTDKEYRETNREKLKVRSKKYRESNPDKANATCKKYRESNPEKVKATQKKYYEANSYYIDCECGRSVMKRGLTQHKKSQIHQQWEQSI